MDDAEIRRINQERDAHTARMRSIYEGAARDIRKSDDISLKGVAQNNEQNNSKGSLLVIAAVCVAGYAVFGGKDNAPRIEQSPPKVVPQRQIASSSASPANKHSAKRAPAPILSSDEAIEQEAAVKIARLISNSGSVRVSSLNRKMLLVGSVPSENDRKAVLYGISQIAAVTTISDNIYVGRMPSVAEQTEDLRLVKAINSLTNPMSVKAAVERSVVYLSGETTQRDAQYTADAVSRVAGVAKVVTLFDIKS